MPTSFLTIATRPAELLNLLGACGANDAYYYACGALLRFQQNLRSSKTYHGPAELTISATTLRCTLIATIPAEL